MLKSVVLASGNAGKLREFKALLEPLGLNVISQRELNIPDAPEPHPTFVENALAKARHASALSGMPALADDSGLCVFALNGAPGVLSARYAAMDGLEHSDSANNQKLQSALAGINNRTAWYVAVLVFLTRPDDPQPIIAEANWFGEIAQISSGSHGFGYDPYFYLPALGCTAADLEPNQKNAISHRGMAMQKLLDHLRVRGLASAPESVSK
jgi:XTP/dITP diphosphohydrolase